MDSGYGMSSLSAVGPLLGTSGRNLGNRDGGRAWSWRHHNVVLTGDFDLTGLPIELRSVLGSKER
jgi:hypothetical protein